MKRPVPAILALTPGDLGASDAPRVLAAARAAVRAGVDGVMLREPALDDRACLELAEALRAALGPEPWLCVHDRAHVAAAAGADAVHLGFRSLAPPALPAFARGLAVGLSAHAGDPEGAWDGADYVVFGPVRDTPSKRGLLLPTGLDGLARAADRAAREGRALLAIGGLEPEDVGPALAAGARGVCVLRGILGAPDAGAAAARYVAALERARARA